MLDGKWRFKQMVMQSRFYGVSSVGGCRSPFQRLCHTYEIALGLVCRPSQKADLWIIERYMFSRLACLPRRDPVWRTRTKLKYRGSMMRRVCDSGAIATQQHRHQSYLEARNGSKEIEHLEEVKQEKKFHDFLRMKVETQAHASPPPSTQDALIPKDEARMLVLAGFATFRLHVESRIASFLGKGFYTIGPCGEEMMGCLGLLARTNDPLALHYRHLATSIARQLKNGNSLTKILLNRARGYVCSTNDPVTGGRHCAIGGTPYDFYVTSTLASQAPGAVGRALGIGLSSRILENSETRKFPSDAVSIVSVGDGSVNNAMFLSALNMSEYANHRRFRCPILFVITNNEICISLRGYGWLKEFINRTKMQVFKANGLNVCDVWQATTQAINHARRKSKPTMLVIDEVPRRFGHAATDRQAAYLTPEEIEYAANMNPLESLCETFVDDMGHFTWKDLENIWNEIDKETVQAFNIADQEPKIASREQACQNLKAPLVSIDQYHPPPHIEDVHGKSDKKHKPAPMRLRMTEVYFEALQNIKECVYLGEDVRHGGYYLVTDGLYNDFPDRVHDFPPDETSLIGAGIGYSQCGLLPIVEIPYAKYLDCGADMFFEAVLTHWCTNGSQKDGMLIRLQGFDKGVFGGNFHTHNAIHMPPGLDIVCYSNGRDYVRGIRYCLLQAKGGRVVMSVDSTNLLNRRDLVLSEQDSKWMFPYPEPNRNELLTFDHIILYTDPKDPTKSSVDISSDSLIPEAELENVDAYVLTYGNGVPSALNAAIELWTEHRKHVAVIDNPNLGCIPKGLSRLLNHVLQGQPSQPAFVFADICKKGASPLSGLITDLRTTRSSSTTTSNLLPLNWSYVAAEPTYNPLGSTVTFLNENDIKATILHSLA